MKKFFLLAAAMTLGLASCADNDNEQFDGGTPKDGAKEGLVSFAIETEVPAPPAGSRAATADSQPADAEEMQVNGNSLKYVIFSAPDGIVEDSGTMTLEPGTGDYAGMWVTPVANATTIPAGQHYFFVFLNDGALGSGKLSTLPAVGTTFDDWVKDNSSFEIPVTYTGGVPDIAVTQNFLMGSLWKEAKTAPAGAGKDEPEVIRLIVGRLASKVILTAVSKGTSEMAGEFEFSAYRLGTLSKRIYPAGRMDETATALNPFTKNQLVISAVHQAPFVMASSDPTQKVFNTADFERYTSGATFGKSLNEAFYAVENTTSRQDLTLSTVTVADNALFYGNTTYVQVETIYKPTTEETHGVADGAIVDAPQPVPAGDGSFWVGYVGAERIIFNADPSDIENVTNIAQYVEGKNYHKFAVQDQLEDQEGMAKYRVLRNHYYEFAITDIEDLGSWTSDVDPTEPVEEETWIRLAVKVGMWDKVAAGNIQVR